LAAGRHSDFSTNGRSVDREDLMNFRNHSSIVALAIFAVVLLATALFLTGGIGELLVLAVGTLLVTNYLVHRHEYLYPADQHPRHGDRMD
jgi:hypothetical protein